MRSARPENWSEICRASQLARRARGLPIGRPVTGKACRARCRRCRERFDYFRVPSEQARRFCTRLCHLRFQHAQRRKVPADFATLYDLYWTQGLALWAIARRFKTDHCTVRRNLIALGIPRRARARPAATECIVEGCGAKPYKLLHVRIGVGWHIVTSSRLITSVALKSGGALVSKNAAKTSAS
jgi:hypothetical protein